jgi:hypothetical protein
MDNIKIKIRINLKWEFLKWRILRAMNILNIIRIRVIRFKIKNKVIINNNKTKITLIEIIIFMQKIKKKILF